MIVGGADKELEFDVLAREMKRYRVDVAVLLARLTPNYQSHWRTQKLNTETFQV